MLNGVGGRTISEAKERLCYPEFMVWLAYRKKFGSLNQGMRVEYSSAMLASLYANSHAPANCKFTLYDFAPHIEEPPISIEDAIKNWK